MHGFPNAHKNVKTSEMEWFTIKFHQSSSFIAHKLDFKKYIKKVLKIFYMITPFTWIYRKQFTIS